MGTPETTTPPATPETTTPPRPTVSLEQPSKTRGTSKSTKLFRQFRSVFRSLPIITPMCKIPALNLHDNHNHIHSGTRMTGTLFGYRKSRINLVIQETPKSVPVLLLELAIPTGKLLHELGLGLVRIAMECEKNAGDKTKILDEPIWTLYCNGKKSGYGVKREASEDDLSVMQMLHAVSMGAGVLPKDTMTASPDRREGELTFMRASFERVSGSKDSETYYMLSPDGNSGPELSIFFVRI